MIKLKSKFGKIFVGIFLLYSIFAFIIYPLYVHFSPEPCTRFICFNIPPGFIILLPGWWLKSYFDNLIGLGTLFSVLMVITNIIIYYLMGLLIDKIVSKT